MAHYNNEYDIRRTSADHDDRINISMSLPPKNHLQWTLIKLYLEDLLWWNLDVPNGNNTIFSIYSMAGFYSDRRRHYYPTDYKYIKYYIEYYTEYYIEYYTEYYIEYYIVGLLLASTFGLC